MSDLQQYPTFISSIMMYCRFSGFKSVSLRQLLSFFLLLEFRKLIFTIKRQFSKYLIHLWSYKAHKGSRVLLSTEFNKWRVARNYNNSPFNQKTSSNVFFTFSFTDFKCIFGKETFLLFSRKSGTCWFSLLPAV